MGERDEGKDRLREINTVPFKAHTSSIPLCVFGTGKEEATLLTVRSKRNREYDPIMT